MLTMGLAVQTIVPWLGDAGRILDYGVRFTRPVVVDPETGAELTDRREGRRGRRRVRAHRPHREARRARRCSARRRCASVSPEPMADVTPIPLAQLTTLRTGGVPRA